ncbi:MAG TPA: hypothetical protein VHD63_09020 [Ktedonobacteraceae bacterium]|nr:hypothetical protein [Ktedonobacteraceae bacterium]
MPLLPGQRQFLLLTIVFPFSLLLVRLLFLLICWLALALVTRLARRPWLVQSLSLNAD